MARPPRRIPRTVTVRVSTFRVTGFRIGDPHQLTHQDGQGTLTGSGLGLPRLQRRRHLPQLGRLGWSVDELPVGDAPSGHASDEVAHLPDSVHPSRPPRSVSPKCSDY